MQKRKPFLELLSEDTVAQLVARSVPRNWPARTPITLKGEACTGAHFITSGMVKSSRCTNDGREQIVYLLAAGDVIALAPIIDGEPHLVSAITLQPTRTIFLSRAEFDGLFSGNTEFQQAVLAEFSQRIRTAVALLETVALRPVIARVAARIIEVAAEHDALKGRRPFRLALNQEDLAHVLATSRESVARSLGQLRRQSVIQQRGANVRILDREALFELAQTRESFA